MRALLRGEEVDYTPNSARRIPIRFQMREHRFIDLDHPIPALHRGLRPQGAGPGRRKLGGTGAISRSHAAGTVPQMLANVRRGADKAGRVVPADFHTSAMVNVGAAPAGRGRPTSSASSRSAARR